MTSRLTGARAWNARPSPVKNRLPANEAAPSGVASLRQRSEQKAVSIRPQGGGRPPVTGGSLEGFGEGSE